MKQIGYYLLIVCGGGLAACGAREATAPAEHLSPTAEASHSEDQAPVSYASDDAYRDMLLEKANELALSELARLSAAELLYRNTPTPHRIEMADLAPNIGVYTKIYRSFNDYEITDIARSNSFLHPVSYEITFKYDILATDTRPFSLPNAEQLAGGDAQFSVISSNRMTRTYPARADGEPLGHLPELPPRPDFYKRDIESKVWAPQAPSTMGPPPATAPMAPPTAAPAQSPPRGLPPEFSGIDMPPGVRIIEPPAGPTLPK